MKRAAILQSNYIPWKGYFDLINMVDVFILYDDVQFTKNDWRNRNKIKTANGVTWLTIPVLHESLSQSIEETRVSQQLWRKKHWNSLCQSYARAPHFQDYRAKLEDAYLDDSETNLSRINHRFITLINSFLGITTPILWSSEFSLGEGQTARLVDLCKQVGADEYISGPAAKNYLDLKLMDDAGIQVQWMDYSGYPEYPQLHPPFEHAVSVLDLIFNTGQAARTYMKSV